MAEVVFVAPLFWKGGRGARVHKVGTEVDFISQNLPWECNNNFLPLGLLLVHLDLTSIDLFGAKNPTLVVNLAKNENIRVLIAIDVFTLPFGRCYKTPLGHHGSNYADYDN